jgi:hypothetical protein
MQRTIERLVEGRLPRVRMPSLQRDRQPVQRNRAGQSAANLATLSNSFQKFRRSENPMQSPELGYRSGDQSRARRVHDLPRRDCADIRLLNQRICGSTIALEVIDFFCITRNPEPPHLILPTVCRMKMELRQ